MKSLTTPKTTLLGIAILFSVTSCSTINSTGVASFQGETQTLQTAMTTYSLAKGIIKITVKDGAIANIESLIVTDRENTFNIDFTRSPLANDTYEVKTDPNNQTLTNITNIHDDQTGQILVEAAKVVATLTNPLSIPLGAKGLDRSTTTYILVDLSDPNSVEDARQKVSNLLKSSSITFALGGIPLEKTSDSYHLKLKGQTIKNTVFYRPIERSVFSISAEGEIRHSKEITMPRHDLIMGMELKRKAFVNTQYTITFENGAPKEVKAVSPSQGLEIVKIPLKIVDAVISTIPLELRINSARNTQQKTQVTEQQALIVEQLKLLQAQENLLNAQNPTTN